MGKFVMMQKKKTTPIAAQGRPTPATEKTAAIQDQMLHSSRIKWKSFCLRKGLGMIAVGE